MGVADRCQGSVGDQITDRAVQVQPQPLLPARPGVIGGVEGNPPGEEQVDENRTSQAEGEGLPVDVRLAGVVVVAQQEQLVPQRQLRDGRGHLDPVPYRGPSVCCRKRACTPA